MVQRKPNTTCLVCETKIYRRPAQISAGNVYCSPACVGKQQRREKICKICGNAYVGARRTCSHRCANKSRAGIRYTGKRTRDNAYRGTKRKALIAERSNGTCERCGNDNFAILHVHHIHEQFRGGSNSPENLELLCPNCHATHHFGTALYRSK